MFKRGMAAALMLVAVGSASWGLGESPRSGRTEGWSSPRMLLASSELEAVKLDPVKTLDGTAVYRLTAALRNGQEFTEGTELQYEVRAGDGTSLGGGRFTVSAEMLAPGGNSLSVLTGLGGLRPDSRQLILVTLARPPFDFEKNITDTCTTFCDRCSDNAKDLCSNGASSYSCNCADTTRSCTFTCQSSSSGQPTKPPV